MQQNQSQRPRGQNEDRQHRKQRAAAGQLRQALQHDGARWRTTLLPGVRLEQWLTLLGRQPEDRGQPDARV